MSEKEPMSEYRKEWMLTILKLAHSRASRLDEVLRLTREIGDSLSRNDQVSVEMLLKMRGEELEAIAMNTQEAQAFKMQLRRETQQEINKLLEGKVTDAQDDMASKIVETINRCQRLLEEIRIIDERMSKRIAGEDSFYEK
ncbi:hypothetical protein D3Z38_12340 [Clostridiales bacterium]|nr:hypothetical protein [Clostridiales bacterium]